MRGYCILMRRNSGFGDLQCGRCAAHFRNLTFSKIRILKTFEKTKRVTRVHTYILPDRELSVSHWRLSRVYHFRHFINLKLENPKFALMTNSTAATRENTAYQIPVSQSVD